MFKNLDLELDNERKAEIKQHMMETSEKPKAMPKKLYHATILFHLGGINEYGLKANPVFGEIYLCEKPRQCLKFVPRPCVIFEVETKNLDENLLFLSKDHKKIKSLGTNFEAYTYYGDISPKFLTYKYMS